MSDPPAPRRLIFVGGLHRSGTTLLAQLLAEHPEITGLHHTGAPHDEGQHLQDVMPTAAALGGPGHFALAPKAHLTEHDVDDAGTTRARLTTAWSPYVDPARSIWVEKSPPNLVRFRYLQRVFPGAACIAIVRHPVAVAYASEFWAEAGTAHLLEHWLVAHETLASDRPHIDGLQVVRYEDLVADPTGTITAIDERLGLAPHAPQTEVQRATNVRYFKRFRHHPVVPARLHIARHVRRFEARLQALGYGYSLLDRGDVTASSVSTP